LSVAVTGVAGSYNGYDPTDAEVDGSLENVQSPEALLDTVQLLISKREVNEPMNS